MSNLLSQLTKSEETRFLEELNYMNLQEIRGFCSKRGIPYRIVAECSNGKVKATKDTDRKPIVLARVRRYLRGMRRTRGEAPTLEEFARSWTKAKAEQHRLPTPEYAYLTDLRHQRADGDWKALRKAKAASALEALVRIAPVRASSRTK